MEKTLARMEKWLTDNNFKFRRVTMTEGNKGLMVDTDYNGQFPPMEVYAQHNTITKRARKAGLKTEARGFHTALLITE